MKVKEISGEKGGSLYTITPERTVHEAIKRLCDFNIGALPVVSSSGELVGILSERDVLRLCARDDCRAVLGRKVEEIMTRDVVIGVPNDDVNYVMRVMTDRRIRHLPIVEDGQLAAMISIGDVVKAQYEAQEIEVRYLRDYVGGATA
jgi:CBS domain-containing protein